MLKKIPITLLFTLVVAVIALFAATEVMAQDCDPVDICSAGPYTIEAVRGLNGEFPVKETIEYPPGSGTLIDVQRYEYQYTAGDTSKIDHVHFGIVHDCKHPVGIYLFPGQEYEEPCAGADSDKWLEYDCTARVLTINLQGNKAWFYSDTATTGPMSHHIRAGKKAYGCSDPLGLIGPNPFGPSYYVLYNLQEELIFQGKKFCITKDQSGCPVEVKVCDDIDGDCSDPEDCYLLTPQAMSDAIGYDNVGDTGETCPFSGFYGESSPGEGWLCWGNPANCCYTW